MSWVLIESIYKYDCPCIISYKTKKGCINALWCGYKSVKIKAGLYEIITNDSVYIVCKKSELQGLGYA